MTRKNPNPLQKLVRGVIRDLIDQVNSQTTDQPAKRKSKKKSAATKSESKPKQEKKKRSRHIPASVRVTVLHRDGLKCVFCGRGAPKVELEVDHILPFSKGGSNDPSNLQTLCFDCNRGKGARRLK
ncbi:HNH endonuclease [Microseira wollei]|uniref:HNH endonuclease domain protein n=1 Tax=Microseira wollei NIES-4236 TaxID=2530354 RepID=A0AAV3X526_9CYAN|nr:HNH endonuclease [Microseira wollei]GET35287.1 HNH endonuclease domain protein [Microseira wollei NIES-4236]